MPTLRESVTGRLPHIVSIRHDLHAHPELGYNEHRTSELVQRELGAAGIRFAAGLAKGTGVLGWLPATTNPDTATTIALRADMDALPILEETGLPYASTHTGVMHACGHDGHTSILIGAAQVLAETTERPNNLLFLFQPAEEGGAGGRAMCEDGVLDGRVLGKRADFVFGLHGHPIHELGRLVTCVGPMMAAADSFEIVVHAKGGHAAMPHLSIDPILVASHIVTALQSIPSRNVSPLDSLVITVAMVQAGTAHNIIPDSARMVGTIRTLTPGVRDLAFRRIEEVATNVAAAFGATAKATITPGYPVTSNASEAVARFREAVGAQLGTQLEPEEAEPTMGAEDFSYYGFHAPACFYWLGLAPEGNPCPGLHTPRFDFNDGAIETGMMAMCSLALSR
ncbi:MAG: amidohydrolase [Fimbriimonadales bacterium]